MAPKMRRGLRQVGRLLGSSIWLLTRQYQKPTKQQEKKTEVILVDKQLEEREMCPDIRPVEWESCRRRMKADGPLRNQITSCMRNWTPWKCHTFHTPSPSWHLDATFPLRGGKYMIKTFWFFLSVVVSSAHVISVAPRSPLIFDDFPAATPYAMQIYNEQRRHFSIYAAS